MFSLSSRNKMSDQDMHHEREVTLVISNLVVKGCHECPFSAEIWRQIFARKKKGSLGQLGHLHRFQCSNVTVSIFGHVCLFL